MSWRKSYKLSKQVVTSEGPPQNGLFPWSFPYPQTIEFEVFLISYLLSQKGNICYNKDLRAKTQQIKRKQVKKPCSPSSFKKIHCPNGILNICLEHSTFSHIYFIMRAGMANSMMEYCFYFLRITLRKVVLLLRRDHHKSDILRVQN